MMMMQKYKLVKEEGPTSPPPRAAEHHGIKVGGGRGSGMDCANKNFQFTISFYG
jgi:hypothetical protein